MVQAKKDAITGAFRDAVYMNAAAADALEVQAGDRILLKNPLGEFHGRVYFAPLQRGNLQIRWPEGNVLLDKNKRSQEGVSDYNALVQMLGVGRWVLGEIGETLPHPPHLPHLPYHPTFPTTPPNPPPQPPTPKSGWNEKTRKQRQMRSRICDRPKRFAIAADSYLSWPATIGCSIFAAT